jgi:hypothetical protein
VREAEADPQEQNQRENACRHQQPVRRETVSALGDVAASL